MENLKVKQIGDSFKVTINTCYDENEEVELLIIDKSNDSNVLYLTPRYLFLTPHLMNNINTIKGGYEASKMKTKILPEYEKAFKKVLKGKIVNFDLFDKDDVLGISSFHLFRTNFDYVEKEIFKECENYKIGNCRWWLQNPAPKFGTAFECISFPSKSVPLNPFCTAGVRPLIVLDLYRYSDNNDKCNKKYIRFGDLPEGLVSKIHKGDGVYEQDVKGVSVWNCVETNGLEYPILPLNPNKDAIADYFNLIYSDRPIYIVTGTEVGIGHDGEPLLGNDIKILENITEWYGYKHGRKI